MNRIILINRTRAPSRDELSTTERARGESLLAAIPGLHWAGYVIAQGANRKSANWLVSRDGMDQARSVIPRLNQDQSEYEVALYTRGTNWAGGQCETRII